METPLVDYVPFTRIDCGPAKPLDVVYSAGAGVLENKSVSQVYRITGVEFVDPVNITAGEAFLVPGVGGGGQLNSVVPRMGPKFIAGMQRGTYWPWEKRVPAVGAVLAPGGKGEVVAKFVRSGPGPWRFSAIRTSYTDHPEGRTRYEHVQPMSSGVIGAPPCEE